MKLFISTLITISVLLTGCTGLDTPLVNNELIDEFKAIELETKEVEQGVMINLPTIMLFDFDKADLKNESRSTIKKISGILNRPGTEEYEILVNGYADSTGEEEYNLTLSQDRAGSVLNEFVFNGIHKSRMKSKGFGEKFPVAPNRHANGIDNPEGRAKNRRVEVIIKTADTK